MITQKFTKNNSGFHDCGTGREVSWYEIRVEDILIACKCGDTVLLSYVGYVRGCSKTMRETLTVESITADSPGYSILRLVVCEPEVKGEIIRTQYDAVCRELEEAQAKIKRRNELIKLFLRDHREPTVGGGSTITSQISLDRANEYYNKVEQLIQQVKEEDQ